MTDAPSAEAPFTSGFVTIVGRPNVGKSTLLNRLVGTKVSIVSDRPQTTRNQVRGVLNLPGAQIVFIDTPGLHKPKTELGRRLNQRAAETFAAVDAVCFVVEASAALGPGDRLVAGQLAAAGTPVVAVVNKVDIGSRDQILGHLAGLGGLADFHAYVPVSALTGDGTGALVDELRALMPEGPRYYPEGVVTDQGDEFLAAELIREKLLAMAREELPHSLNVTITEMEERETDEGPLISMRAVIGVERDSQKGIVIGKGGAVLKAAGTAARTELEALLGARVFLTTHVKVDKNWQQSPRALDRLGY